MRKAKGWFLILMIFLLILSGCSKKEEFGTFKGQEGDWTLSIPTSFEIIKEERIEEQDMFITSFQDDKGKSFSITETLNSDREINEEVLLAELAVDEYVHVLRKEEIKLNDGTIIYGALAEDESIEYNLLYYKLKKDSKELTFIIYQKQPFSLEDEAQLKAMISTFKAS